MRNWEWIRRTVLHIVVGGFLLGGFCGLWGVAVRGESEPQGPSVRGLQRKGRTHQVAIAPGGDAFAAIQGALRKASAGDVVEIPEGTFSLPRSLVVGQRIHLRGKGMRKTILSFKQQLEGGQGILVDANGVTVEGLTIEDTPGDGLRAHRVSHLAVRHVRVRWNGSRLSTNGAYGIYPVLSKHIKIEHCEVSGASDAGIYVGQSSHIIIRHNVAFHNVAGIELENSSVANISNNRAFNNTVGIMIFRVPCLCQEGSSQIRLHHNLVSHNNHPNFARKDSELAGVPLGSGIFVGAVNHMEIANNEIIGHLTFSLMLASYVFTTQAPAPFSCFDAFPRKVSIHHNRISKSGCCVPSDGQKCAYQKNDLLSPLAKKLQEKPMPICLPFTNTKSLPDIMYEDPLLVPKSTNATDASGQKPSCSPFGICVYDNIHDNDIKAHPCAQFAGVYLRYVWNPDTQKVEAKVNVRCSRSPYQCSLPSPQVPTR